MKQEVHGMEQSVWQNRWLCSPRFQGLKPLSLLHKEWDTSFQAPEHREDLKNIHTVFRKNFTLSQKAERAILRISADDYYKLYVNGRYITQGPANSYAFCYYYNEVDLSKELQVGENVIAVHVYYQGLVNRAYNSGDYRQGMIAELWADDRQLLDEHWKCCELTEYGWSRTMGYETQFDEIVDNRRKQQGWKQVDFDDSRWEDAVVCREDDYVLIPQPCENVVTQERFPVKVKRLANGYLLDFGELLTGTFYMQAVGQAGNEILIRYGEELSCEDASEQSFVRYKTRCNCHYEDKLILAEGLNELESFEYKSFRYVQLLTDAAASMEGFKVYFRHYPFDDSGCKFKTKDPLLAQIWQICRNAVRNCSQEAFLDCPSREKGQYLGDLTVAAHALYCLTGDTSLFKKALLDFAHSTVICKGMMAVAPGSFMQEIADFSLLYPYQLLMYWHFTKDLETVQAVFPAAEGVEAYFEQFQNASGMLEQVNTKWNLVDWPANLRDAYDFDLPQAPIGPGCHNVINALHIGMKRCMEELRKIPGISASKDARKGFTSEQLKKQFIHDFYKEETGLFVDTPVSTHSSVHANAFAAFFDLAPKENHIAEFFMQRGLCCGVFVSYFVLYGLIRLGHPEMAYAMIINKSEHSWYQMLSEGATTAFEAWGKEQKGNTSLCHAWAAAPIPVLMELQRLNALERKE